MMYVAGTSLLKSKKQALGEEASSLIKQAQKPQNGFEYLLNSISNTNSRSLGNKTKNLLAKFR